ERGRGWGGSGADPGQSPQRREWQGRRAARGHEGSLRSTLDVMTTMVASSLTVPTASVHVPLQLRACDIRPTLILLGNDGSLLNPVVKLRPTHPQNLRCLLDTKPRTRCGSSCARRLACSWSTTPSATISPCRR